MLKLRDDVVTIDINLAGTLMEQDFNEKREAQRLSALMGAGVLAAFGGGNDDDAEVYVDGVKY